MSSFSAVILRATYLFDQPNRSVSIAMTSKEMKRWLASLGATFEPGKGGHLKIRLGKKRSVLPMHAGDLKIGTEAAIKKQLGLR